MRQCLLYNPWIQRMLVDKSRDPVLSGEIEFDEKCINQQVPKVKKTSKD